MPLIRHAAKCSDTVTLTIYRYLGPIRRLHCTFLHLYRQTSPILYLAVLCITPIHSHGHSLVGNSFQKIAIISNHDPIAHRDLKCLTFPVRANDLGRVGRI
jgi:hypothetical protein